MKRFFKIYLILIVLMSGSYANDKLYQFMGVNYVLNDRYDIDFGYRYLVTNGENSAGLNNLILSLHYFY
ncbi:MAG: hypothetical protein IE881_03020 [Epsilonproteobacteria bacterium]|nr:hypothetical protein [Campylobacterota bacterium]